MANYFFLVYICSALIVLKKLLCASCVDIFGGFGEQGIILFKLFFSKIGTKLDSSKIQGLQIVYILDCRVVFFGDKQPPLNFSTIWDIFMASLVYSWTLKSFQLQGGFFRII